RMACHGKAEGNGAHRQRRCEIRCFHFRVLATGHGEDRRQNVSTAFGFARHELTTQLQQRHSRRHCSIGLWPSCTVALLYLPRALKHAIAMRSDREACGRSGASEHIKKTATWIHLRRRVVVVEQKIEIQLSPGPARQLNLVGNAGQEWLQSRLPCISLRQIPGRLQVEKRSIINRLALAK